MFETVDMPRWCDSQRQGSAFEADFEFQRSWLLEKLECTDATRYRISCMHHISVKVRADRFLISYKWLKIMAMQKSLARRITCSDTGHESCHRDRYLRIHRVTVSVFDGVPRVKASSSSPKCHPAPSDVHSRNSGPRRAITKYLKSRIIDISVRSWGSRTISCVISSDLCGVHKNQLREWREYAKMKLQIAVNVAWINCF